MKNREAVEGVAGEDLRIYVIWEKVGSNWIWKEEW